MLQLLYWKGFELYINFGISTRKGESLEFRGRERRAEMEDIERDYCIIGPIQYKEKYSTIVYIHVYKKGQCFDQRIAKSPEIYGELWCSETSVFIYTWV